MTSLRHPFRAPPLSGADAGWGRCVVTVVLALVLPAVMSGLLLYAIAPVFSGPPKDGNDYTVWEHLTMVLGLVTASVVVSGMLAPVALLLLRLAAMSGWAGWGSAMLAAVAVGLPSSHYVLNGDITTESTFLLPHLCAALALLGLSVWAVFWGLVGLGRKRKRASTSC